MIGCVGKSGVSVGLPWSLIEESLIGRHTWNVSFPFLVGGTSCCVTLFIARSRKYCALEES
jgi:hypothetical protein